MSNCNSCKKKFALLNLDRRRCKECDLYFCYNCMPTIFGSYCKVCKILNTRPALHSSITKLKARDIKVYLSRRKVQTDSYIEKDELVRCFLKYVALEPQLKNKRTYSIKTQNSRYSSTPNLAATHRERVEDTSIPQTPPARPSYTSQNVPSSSNIETNVQMQTSQDNIIDTENIPTTNNSAFSTEPVQETQSDLNISSQPMKLSNIKDEAEIQQLTIRQLKEILLLNRVNFKGCVEKDELRNKVTQLWNEKKDSPDVSDLPTGELCKICMDAPLNSVLLECGHIVSCIDCGKQLAECPVCRQYVVRVVHTFKA